MAGKDITSITLDPQLRDAVDSIAAEEVEGNRSQMIRKLIREAIAARQPKQTREAQND